MILLAGPCVIENEDTGLRTCEFLKKQSERYDLDFYFKSSFDKSNRSSVESYRGPGIEKGLKHLSRIKEQFGVKIITDFHEPGQINELKDVVDMIQIPAFLSRQTDMLRSASFSGLKVNVKKGQFLAPWDMKNVVEKLKYFGANIDDIYLTERGTSFGYNNLVVDYRSFPVMKETGTRVLFDATHSLQLPGGMGSSSGGQKEFIPYLARAAAGCGVDGFFMEIHPDPSKALCDGPNMLDFKMTEKILFDISRIQEVVWI